jgi:hypothetical protein
MATRRGYTRSAHFGYWRERLTQRGARCYMGSYHRGHERLQRERRMQMTASSCPTGHDISEWGSPRTCWPSHWLPSEDRRRFVVCTPARLHSCQPAASCPLLAILPCINAILQGPREAPLLVALQQWASRIHSHGHLPSYRVRDFGRISLASQDVEQWTFPLHAVKECDIGATISVVSCYNTALYAAVCKRASQRENKVST